RPPAVLASTRSGPHLGRGGGHLPGPRAGLSVRRRPGRVPSHPWRSADAEPQAGTDGDVAGGGELLSRAADRDPRRGGAAAESPSSTPDLLWPGWHREDTPLDRGWPSSGG